MIKCIVCDMDGTLIKPDDTLEENTLKALKHYINEGIEFIIATGRDINMVVDFLAMYDIHCDCILNNGAQYYRKDGSSDFYPMIPEAFIEIATILDHYGYLLAIHTDHGMYSLCDADDFWDYHMKLLNKMPREFFVEKTFTVRERYLRTFHYARTPEDIIHNGVHPLKIDARHMGDYSIEGVRKQLNIPHLDISSSFEDNIEITSDTSNKGILLEKVVEQKGYSKDEVAVFGDGENDAAMLEYFTYSFAPANAGKHAKKAAKYQLKTTDQQGCVYEGIRILEDLKLL